MDCSKRDSISNASAGSPLSYFDNMIPNCLEYARQAKAAGRPIIAIMCEYTPREIILAAGAVPVCLCGGSAETIAPAERFLPSNLCPLIKSTFGYHVTDSNPFLKMADLIVAETTCDGKKKMYELLSRDKPMYVLELPQKPHEADAFDHWLSQLKKFRQYLAQRFDVEITESRLTEAIKTMNRERLLRRRLAKLMQSDNPPLGGSDLLKLKSTISGIESDLEQYQTVLTYLESNNGRDLADRTRVLLTGVPLVHGAERVMNIIESSGGLVVCAENCTGLKPILQDVNTHDDPMTAIAAKYLNIPCSVMTPNHSRVESLLQLIDQYRPDCIIDLIWQNCLTYDVESFLIRHQVAEKASLPYLKIVTDYSSADSKRIALRVQALFETVQSQTNHDR